MSGAGWRAAALALLLALPCSTAASVLQVSFAEPAQAQGHLEAKGAWALFLFHGDSASLRVETGSASAQNQTSWMLSDYRQDGDGAAAQPAALPVTSQDFPQGIHGRLGPGPSWASLYIEADSIDVEMPQASATLVHADSGGLVYALLPGDTRPPRSVVEQPGGETPPLVPETGAALAVRGPKLGTSFPFSLHATGVTRLEWHNNTLACDAACPDSGGPYSAAVGVRGQTRVERLTYVNVDAADGSIAGNGTALAIATGASSLDGALTGSLRLPDAQVTGQCPHAACPNPDGRTFQAQGNVQLRGLQPAGAGRLQMRMEGDLSSALFDEAPASGFTVAQAVVVGAIAVGGIVVGLVALFARSERPPVLHHPKRQQLHQLIRIEPGLSSRDLQRRLDWPRGTFLFHIKRLVEDHEVLAKPYKNTVRYFDARSPPSWHGVVLQDPDARRLLDWLQGNPNSDQTRIAAEAHAWGWNRNRVRRHLADLDRAGLLNREPVGRRILYHVKAA